MAKPKMCENGCDAPVARPSRVICQACIDRISATLEGLVKKATRDSGVCPECFAAFADGRCLGRCGQ